MHYFIDNNPRVNMHYFIDNNYPGVVYYGTQKDMDDLLGDGGFPCILQHIGEIKDGKMTVRVNVEGIVQEEQWEIKVLQQRRQEWKQANPKDQLVTILGAASGQAILIQDGVGQTYNRAQAIIDLLEQAQQILEFLPNGRW